MGFAFHRKRKKTGADVINHFNLRCMERIGMVLSQDELKHRMLSHRLRSLGRESNARTHFLVPNDMLPFWHKEEMVAVYDKKRHNFVTVLFNNGGEFFETSSFD
jgi:hypothetical protein